MREYNFRKETKIGILLFVVYSLLNYSMRDMLGGIALFELFLGGLLGVGLVELIVGVLPEKTYLKLKEWKDKLFHTRN